MRKIPLIRPYIDQEIKDKVLDVLDSGFLTEGTVTRDLEEAFRNYINVSYAIAITSCTTGLECALRVLGIQSGDEVIIPDYTYPATANVALILGAKVVIVDVNQDDMLIDYKELENAITSKTRAILPVSLFGNPLNYDLLNNIRNRYGIAIVEDAACSIGAEYKGIKAGKFADLSVFSMHPRKFITTGEGGILTTDNPEHAEWISSYKHFGMGSSDLSSAVFQQIGTNYKISDVVSAIGLCQMNMLDKLIGKRRELANNYINLLQDEPSIRIPDVTPGGTHSWQSFCIFIENRDSVLRDMRNKGIEVQIGSYALHQQPCFSNSSQCRKQGELSGSQYSFNHAMVLPLFHDLTYDDQIYVVDELLKSIRICH